MIDFNSWLVDSEAIAEAPRAVRAYSRIQDKPTSVVFKTPAGTVLTAQTVRLESDDRAAESEGAAGMAPVRKVIVFGVQNHPTITDTDMKEGYRFVHLQDEYMIVDVISTLGELQATAEATG